MNSLPQDIPGSFKNFIFLPKYLPWKVDGATSSMYLVYHGPLQIATFCEWLAIYLKTMVYVIEKSQFILAKPTGSPSESCLFFLRGIESSLLRVLGLNRVGNGSKKNTLSTLPTMDFLVGNKRCILKKHTCAKKTSKS